MLTARPRFSHGAWTRLRPHLWPFDGPEDDFDSHAVHLFFAEIHHVVKPLLMNSAAGLLEELNLLFDDTGDETCFSTIGAPTLRSRFLSHARHFSKGTWNRKRTQGTLYLRARESKLLRAAAVRAVESTTLSRLMLTRFSTM